MPRRDRRRQVIEPWLAAIAIGAALGWAGWLSVQVASTATSQALTAKTVHSIALALKEAEIPMYGVGVQCNEYTRNGCSTLFVRVDGGARTGTLQENTTSDAID